MKVERKIHHGWIEHQNTSEHFKQITQMKNPNGMFGKWQYIYSDNKGNKISLVHLDMRFKGFQINSWDEWWEIYQLEGKDNLFEDVEKFGTKKKAEVRIKELLK